MYSKMFKSKKICIKFDEDWKKLLERFDVNKFKLSSNKRRYTNETECALCARYNGETGYCYGCPFIQFKRPESQIMQPRHGCSVIMDELLQHVSLTPRHHRAIFAQVSKVFYHAEDRLRAPRELKLITDFLKSFKEE